MCRRHMIGLLSKNRFAGCVFGNRKMHEDIDYVLENFKMHECIGYVLRNGNKKCKEKKKIG